MWLPLADPGPYDWIEVATEPRLVALPWAHPLARRDDLDIADLLDEPFLALPASAGSLRDFWLATDARDGRPPVIGAEIASTEETVEALTAGLGVCLLAAGNAPLITRDGVAIRPITGITPSRLVLAWRRNDDRLLLAHLRDAVVGRPHRRPRAGPTTIRHRQRRPPGEYERILLRRHGESRRSLVGGDAELVAHSNVWLVAPLPMLIKATTAAASTSRRGVVRWRHGRRAPAPLERSGARPEG